MLYPLRRIPINGRIIRYDGVYMWNRLRMEWTPPVEWKVGAG